MSLKLFADFKLRLPAIVFTTALLSLVSFALGASVGYPGLIVAAALFSALVLARVFPRSDFFNLVYSNGIAVYACLFGFFSESLFLRLEEWHLSLGFALPIVAFLIGSLLRREEIKSILAARSIQSGAISLSRAIVWIVPVMSIGIAAFSIPLEDWNIQELEGAFFGSMLTISLIVLWASRDIAVLLMDTGVLFEDFMLTASEMVQPALAFFTIYSLDIVIFSCIYRSIDQLSRMPHFMVEGVARDLDFTESLYFSFVTLSTVGYGDILPATDAIRLVVGAQVLTGILFILFGVHAVMGHMGRKQQKK